MRSSAKTLYAACTFKWTIDLEVTSNQICILIYGRDRTCCSTKSGASPLRGNHSVDETLLDLMRASSNEPGGTLVEVGVLNEYVRNLTLPWFSPRNSSNDRLPLFNSNVSIT